MCGFVGQLGAARGGRALDRASELISHRGPDDDGGLDAPGISIRFRRLAIVDLDAGHQPMWSADGRFAIAFNGEVYNHDELREELRARGERFRTRSEAEVILAAYARFGADVVNRLRGMFAFVIWDAENQELFAARDRFGIKPLFFTDVGGHLWFASEAKALTEGWARDVDLTSLQHYFTFQYVPGERTMRAGVRELRPGHRLFAASGRPLRMERYWRPELRPGRRAVGDEPAHIRAALEGSVRVHMRADVPVGAFLSGGIDSAAVAALARRVDPSLQTFTVGFERDGYSELDAARRTADALGLHNRAVVVTPEDLVRELPRIVWHLDDPVADPSAIPLFFLAREAARHVKVVLSGEGADELFGGYGIYREPAALRPVTALPPWGRRRLGALAARLPGVIRGRGYLMRGATALEERFVGNARLATPAQVTALLRSSHPSHDPAEITAPVYEHAAGLDDVSRMQAIDLETWLPGDILMKADRMTMAHGLELRVPFLDTEVFAVARRLPPEAKVDGRVTKVALRHAMRSVVPDGVVGRRKLGFPVPIRHWLADELYGWADDLIRESDTAHLLDRSAARAMLVEHRAGRTDLSRRIWAVLVFCVWHRLFVEEGGDRNVWAFSRVSSAIGAQERDRAA